MGRRSVTTIILSRKGNDSSAGGITRLRSVARGQAFVFSTDHYPPAAVWLEAVIARPGRD